MRADLQAFWQAFPKLACFCPRISKEIFGGFVRFQMVTRVANLRAYFQSFSPRWPPFGLPFGAIRPLSAKSRREGSSAFGRRPRAFSSRVAEGGFHRTASLRVESKHHSRNFGFPEEKNAV